MEHGDDSLLNDPLLDDPILNGSIDADEERRALHQALRDAILLHSDEVASMFAAACQRDLQRHVQKT